VVFPEKINIRCLEYATSVKPALSFGHQSIRDDHWRKFLADPAKAVKVFLARAKIAPQHQ
jgi:hypothetical protein